MLVQARSKRWPRGVSFAHGFAQQLGRSAPEWGITEPLAGVMAAYLFRNVDERDEVPSQVP